MNVYLLTTGKIEKSIDVEYTNVYNALTFTNLKKAYKQIAIEKKQLEPGYFIELEQVRLSNIASEILRYNLKNTNSHHAELLNAFNDCYNQKTIVFITK